MSSQQNKRDLVVLAEINKILQEKGGNIPESKRKEIAITLATRFSGPLPPPDILQAYEEIVPGSAKMIFDCFQKQSDHRIKLEDYAVRSQIFQSGLGQVFGFILSAGCVGASIYVSYLGFVELGVTLGGITVVALATIFVKGKVAQSKNLENKK